MKVLVSGASGFIGKHLQQKLVATPDIKDITLVPWERKRHGDFLIIKNVQFALESVRPDIFIHFAWLSTNSPHYEFDPMNETWAESTIETLSRCHKMGIKSLVAGSIADEWSLENETSAYSLAKKRIRDYVNEQASAFITLMRFHYIFSEAEFRPRILSQVRENALTRITNPNRMHDFIHIRDTVEAIYGLLRSSTPSIVDIASGRLHTVTQLVQIFLERERVSFCQKTCGVSNVNLNFLKSIEWSPTETNRYFHGNSDTLFK